MNSTNSEDYRFCQSCGAPLPRCEANASGIPSVSAADTYGRPRSQGGGLRHRGQGWENPAHTTPTAGLCPVTNRCEPVEHAAIREIREETGLSVELDSLESVFSYADWPPVSIVYSARLDHGTLVPGGETKAPPLFAPDEFPGTHRLFQYPGRPARMSGRPCQARGLILHSPPDMHDSNK